LFPAIATTLTGMFRGIATAGFEAWHKDRVKNIWKIYENLEIVS
jgi:hypothetical protein